MSDDELYLFNRPAFLALQDLPGRHTLALHHPRTGQREAVWHLYEHAGVAWSPRRATFGGPQFAADLPPERLDELLAQADVPARERGWRAIEIKAPPHCFEPRQQSLLATLLHAHGYRQTQADLTYYLPLRGDVPFENRLHDTARKRRRRAAEMPFVVTEEPTADLAEVHAMIAATRHRKGYPVTMTAEQLTRAVRTLPEHYRVWTARREGALVAVACVVVVRHDLLYTLYVGDEDAHRRWSPVTLLYEALYDWGRAGGYRFLDFGIGTDASVPNWGLMQFKRSLGGVPALKSTYRKEYR
ncbi:MAG: GNAT family N-acetyltransferase [Catalinimonas sp.]